MHETGSTVVDRWQLRSVPEERAQRYRAEGYWTDETLGQAVARGLGRMGAAAFRVSSVDAALAGHLCRRLAGQTWPEATTDV